MCLSRACHRARQQRGGRPWWRGLACWWAPSLLQVRLRAVCGLLGCAQNFWKTEGINDNPACAKRRWRECFPHLRYSVLQAVFRLRQAKCPRGSFLLPSLQENLRLVSKWWMPRQVSEVSYCILINSIWFFFSFFLFLFPPFGFFHLNLSFSLLLDLVLWVIRRRRPLAPPLWAPAEPCPALVLPTAMLLGPSGGTSGGHQLWGEV